MTSGQLDEAELDVVDGERFLGLPVELLERRGGAPYLRRRAA